MKIIRVFSGDDGRSRFERKDLESSPELKSTLRASSVTFTTMPAGHFMNLHPAPQHQIVITLEGQMELGLEDGTVEVFGPGDVLIAEDVHGRGHTLRITSQTPRVSVNVPLVD